MVIFNSYVKIPEGTVDLNSSQVDQVMTANRAQWSTRHGRPAGFRASVNVPSPAAVDSWRPKQIPIRIPKQIPKNIPQNPSEPLMSCFIQQSSKKTSVHVPKSPEKRPVFDQHRRCWDHWKPQWFRNILKNTCTFIIHVYKIIPYIYNIYIYIM